MTSKSATKPNVKAQPPLAQVSCSDAHSETPRTNNVLQAITVARRDTRETVNNLSKISDFARQLERELTIANQTCEQHAKDAVRLQYENRVLCAFINQEMKMTGSDPRIAELEKLIAALPNSKI